MKNDNNPRPPVSALPTYDDALARVLSFVPQLPTESVTLLAATGRVLREAVQADRDQPPFNRSAMDGFALRSAEFVANNTYGVTGGVAAGQRDWESQSDRAGVIRIATGAPIPESFDVVIPIEQCTVSEDRGVEHVIFNKIVNPDQVKPWQNIHRQAKDAAAGQTVLEAGTRMGPAQIGIAAAVGASTVEVSVQPRITLLTSGDEVKPFATETQALESQQIRNSNGPMLTALFEAIGTPLLQHVHIPDESEQTLAAAREALSQSHLVVTVGGVSAGQRDLLPWAWQKLGLDVILHGVAIQPGKPIFVAGPRAEKEASESALNEGEGGGTGQGRLVIGLPGNPVSVLATAHLFVWPAVLRMLGASRGLPWRDVSPVEPMRAKAARQLFRAVRVNKQGQAETLPWQGSGDLMHTGQADGWVRLPLQDDEVAAGERVPFLPLVK